MLFVRTSVAAVVLTALAAMMGVVAYAWPQAAFPAEIVLLAGILWLLNRAFPGRAGINIANVVVSLAALLVTLIYAAMLLSRVDPLVLLLIGAVLTALTVVLSIRRRLRKAEERRGLAGYCERCGYDLRKSFACCPECGANIPIDLARRRRWLGMESDPADPRPPHAPTRS